MEIFKQYIIENWCLILVLLAFTIMLIITVFLDKKTIRRLYILIIYLFLLSFSVFFEFYFLGVNKYPELVKVLMFIRYSSTPFIISLILFALVKIKMWYVMIPAVVLAVINFVSIFTGVVFDLDANGRLVRGVLGYFPYVGVGAYSFVLIYVLIKQSNKQIIEIIPIIFLAFSFASGIVLPLIVGKDYSKVFCTNIAIAVFVYYVFLILELTKKDALTGLLNRQAYYSTIENSHKDITAVVSIDMNGLKRINDTLGHAAGDEAILAISSCFVKAAKFKHLVFRVGGDEFIILCKRTSEKELMDLINNLKEYVSETKYTISVGYSFSVAPDKIIELMVKQSDEMMYADKAKFYEEHKR